MHRDSQKKLLVIACTCDRLEAELRWKRQAKANRSSLMGWAQGVSGVAKFAGPFLPRWLRIGVTLLEKIPLF